MCLSGITLIITQFKWNRLNSGTYTHTHKHIVKAHDHLNKKVSSFNNNAIYTFSLWIIAINKDNLL